MNNSRITQPIIDKCNGCLKIDKENFCEAFNDPHYQWRKGDCYGRMTDLAELAQVNVDMEDYRGHYQAKREKTS